MPRLPLSLLMTEQFVHLNIRTSYSVVDGIGFPDEYTAIALANSQPGLAVNDFMNCYSTLKFFKAATHQSIKPILGAQLLIREDFGCYTVTCLCMNLEGYQNLSALITNSYYEDSYTTYGSIAKTDLSIKSLAGLIVLSGSVAGELGYYVTNNQPDKIASAIMAWKTLLPNDRYYLELQRIGLDHTEVFNQSILKHAIELDVPVVATNAVRFLRKKDYEAHTARVCINQGKLLQAGCEELTYTNEQYFKSTSDMIELFSDIPQAITNTVEIMKRCSVNLLDDAYAFPVFKPPHGSTLEQYIYDCCQAGMTARLSQLDQQQQQVYQARIDTELTIINSMGFTGYFLIVSDFVSWAKENQVPVGPGRGSGGGSLVAYCLNIIDIDPIEHGLLFERFLNPERVSMPDFDIDFCMDKRDLVIDYVVDHYGKEHVAQIITYGTMAAKAVVRDVGRIMGLSPGYVDKIAKMVPFEIGMTLSKALDQSQDLAQLYRTDSEIQSLIDLGLDLEGNIRNVGKHAGGVVIAPKPIVEYMPLYREHGQSGHPVTQFDKDDVETMGLVKFDFLGLRTLTIIDWALKNISSTHSNLVFDINGIALDDQRVYKDLHQDTSAVFQLESRGFSELVKRLKPDCFEDIVALVALYRPGPLQSGMVDDFIERKHGLSQIDYFHPDLKPILETTYGVILYQEQVMKIAQVMARYSLGEADILRRAMGKKKIEEMQRQGAIFIQRSVDNQYPDSLARQVFDLMEKFAGYGFNKSHSVAYALITYQTAWLKTYYPAEFMAAVLSSDMDNTDKVVAMIRCCQRLNILVHPPNINQGEYYFTVNKKSEIMYGLGAIKGLGEPMCEAIVKQRQAGSYEKIMDVCCRLSAFKINRKTLESLITSGACDCFGISRVDLFVSIDRLIHHSQKTLENSQRGQCDLFGQPAEDDFEYITSGFWNERERLKREKSVLGYYLSGHPLKTYQHELKYLPHTPLSDVKVQRNVMICGFVEAIKVSSTKSGRRFAIIALEDLTGSVDVMVYSDLYEEIRHDLASGLVMVIQGESKQDQYNSSYRMIAKQCWNIQSYREYKHPQLSIVCQSVSLTCMDELKSVLSDSPGKSKVVLSITHQNQTVTVSLPQIAVLITDSLIDRLQRMSALTSCQVRYTNG